MKIYITAMSRDKARIEQELGSHMKVLIEHILYLILMPDSTDRSHWMDEIYSFLNNVHKMKSNNRFPTAKQIYEWTYGNDRDLVLDDRFMLVLLRDVSEKENIVIAEPKRTIMKMLDTACSKYFRWLSDRLSKDGAVTKSDVRAVLDSIV